eukprot:GSA25T00003960001.1
MFTFPATMGCISGATVLYTAVEPVKGWLRSRCSRRTRKMRGLVRDLLGVKRWRGVRKDDGAAPGKPKRDSASSYTVEGMDHEELSSHEYGGRGLHSEETC